MPPKTRLNHAARFGLMPTNRHPLTRNESNVLLVSREQLGMGAVLCLHYTAKSELMHAKQRRRMAGQGRVIGRLER
jgi:hypothetical protein